MYGPKAPCARCGKKCPVAARGMCLRCYGYLYDRGQHVDFPRRSHRAEDVVQDLHELLSQGCTKEEIVARMGMQWQSILCAVRRFKRREASA